MAVALAVAAAPRPKPRLRGDREARRRRILALRAGVLRASYNAFLRARGEYEEELRGRIMARLRVRAAKARDPGFKARGEGWELEDIGWEDEGRRLLKKLQPVFTQTAEDAWNAAKGLSGEGGTSFDLSNRGVQRVMADTANRITRMSDTDKAYVRSIVSTAIESHSDHKKLAASLKDAFGMSSKRSMVIARTESAMAFNTSSLRNFGESGLVTWVEVFDGPDCGWRNHDDSDMADGSIRSVSAAEEHPIAHPNCLRAFGPIVGDVPETQLPGEQPDFGEVEEEPGAAPVAAFRYPMNTERGRLFNLLNEIGVEVTEHPDGTFSTTATTRLSTPAGGWGTQQFAIEYARLHPEVQQGMVTGMRALADDIPYLHKRIDLGVGDLHVLDEQYGDNRFGKAYAVCGAKGRFSPGESKITFNNHYGPDGSFRDIKAAGEAGARPGTFDGTQVGRWGVGADANDTMRHEQGHALNNVMTPDELRSAQRIIDSHPPISGYARKEGSTEALAEYYAATRVIPREEWTPGMVEFNALIEQDIKPRLETLDAQPEDTFEARLERRRARQAGGERPV